MNAEMAPVPTGVPGNWELAFDDEFDGSALDRNKWSDCRLSPTCIELNNVTTDPANVSVSGGNLLLTLASPSSGASVSTNPREGAAAGFGFQYGAVEARVFFPGEGVRCRNWPAFWTDSHNWPSSGENDIAEVLDSRMTVNYHSASGSHSLGTVPGSWCGAYHVFTLNRQAGKSDVYYDAKLVKSYATDDAGALQYLVLNIGRGEAPIYGAGSQVKVDYVRAWIPSSN